MSKFRELGFAAALGDRRSPRRRWPASWASVARPRRKKSRPGISTCAPTAKACPRASGTVAQGEEIFQAQCAACHGEFGEGKDRWPALAGGLGTLKADRPDKTVGSFWPYPTTLFDYIAQSHAVRQCPVALARRALCAHGLHPVPQRRHQGSEFRAQRENLASIRMPNAEQFYDDDRETAEKSFWNKQPCMKDCKKAVEITGRARVLDVTPESKTAPRVD